MQSKSRRLKGEWPGCLIIILAAFFYVAAQQPSPGQKKPAPDKTPNIKSKTPNVTSASVAVADESETSFEAMLGADRYLVYGEIRNVGQQMATPDVVNLLNSLQKIEVFPAEAKPLLTFVNSHAEALASTRLMMATMRAQDESKLPQILLALEFTATPDAQKFEPQLQKFLNAAALGSALAGKSYHASQLPQKSGVSFALQRKANVILLADTAIEIKNLRTPESRALAEEPHFQSIRSRLANEPVFIYVNTGEITRGLNKQMQQAVERSRQMQADAAKNEKNDDVKETPPPASEPSPDAKSEVEDSERPPIVSSEEGQVAQEQQQPVQNNEQNATGTLSAERAGGPEALSLLPMLFGSFLGGGGALTQWPEGAGAALAYEGDSLVIRSLITTESGENVNPVPMLSMLRSGPAIALEAPALVPENAELMVSASLNLPRMFDSFMTNSFVRTGSGNEPVASSAEAEIAAMESKYGFSLRNELFPVIGNEIAVTIPLKEFFSSSRGVANEKTDPNATGFLIYLSLRDKDAAQKLLPRVLEAFGMKGADQMLVKETRGDVEILTSPLATLAFINNFLVAGQTAPEVYRAVDAYNQHQTLASSSRYAEAIGWQPAQKLAQFYLSESMMKGLIGQTKTALERANNSTRNAFADFNPEARPVTFAVSSDGAGVLHELHLPKSLITTLIAGAAADSNKLPYAKNEDEVAGSMQSVYYYQMQFYATKGNKTYATLEQLNKMEVAFPSTYWDKIGYRLEINAMGEKFEATATPREYGTTGKMSYFIDETGVLRGADNGGNRATAADKAVSRY